MKNYLLICSSLLMFLYSCKSDNPVQNDGNLSDPVINSIINTVNIDSLMLSVKQLSGEVPFLIEGKPDTIKDRKGGSTFHKIAQKYLVTKLSACGLEIQLQNFSGSNPGQNILAFQRGTKYPAKKYILCAHYDSYSTSKYAPGADDNGSGVAAVLEAARILSKYKSEYTLVYVLWDQEEPGLVGSRFFAGKAAAESDSIMGVINMDMIGYDSNGDEICRIHAKDDSNSKSIAERLLNNNNIYKIGLNLSILTPPQAQSDQISFWEKGFGAVCVQEDFWSDYDKQLHTEYDDTRTFSNKYFLDCSKLVISSIASLSRVKDN